MATPFAPVAEIVPELVTSLALVSWPSIAAPPVPVAVIVPELVM
jgi:hypothetical protein